MDTSSSRALVTGARGVVRGAQTTAEPAAGDDDVVERLPAVGGLPHRKARPGCPRVPLRHLTSALADGYGRFRVFPGVIPVPGRRAG